MLKILPIKKSVPLDLPLEVNSLTSKLSSHNLKSEDLSPEVMFTQNKDPNNKSKPQFRKYCNYCHKSNHSISNCFRKQRANLKKEKEIHFQDQNPLRNHLINILKLIKTKFIQMNNLHHIHMNYSSRNNNRNRSITLEIYINRLVLDQTLQINHEINLVQEKIIVCEIILRIEIFQDLDMIPIIELEISYHHIVNRIETDLNRFLHLDQIQEIEEILEIIPRIIDLLLDQE